MSLFPATVGAYLEGRSIGASLLVLMDFTSGARRWWTGFGNLVAGGHTWQGTGELIAIEGLEASLGTAATATTFTLSGVDPTLVTTVQAASAEVKDRLVRVYLQAFHVDSPAPEMMVYANLDEPVAIWSGRMDVMKYSASGPGERTITVTAENLWTSRRKPPFGLLTDQDQAARHPGDKGLRQVANLVKKVCRWPTYAWVLCGLSSELVLIICDQYSSPGIV